MDTSSAWTGPKLKSVTLYQKFAGTIEIAKFRKKQSSKQPCTERRKHYNSVCSNHCNLICWTKTMPSIGFSLQLHCTKKMPKYQFQIEQRKKSTQIHAKKSILKKCILWPNPVEGWYANCDTNLTCYTHPFSPTQHELNTKLYFLSFLKLNQLSEILILKNKRL